MPDNSDRPTELQEALVECRRRSLEADSTFHFALRFLPPEDRDALHVLYYFCRRVDDAVDEPRKEERSRELLEQLRSGLAGDEEGELWTGVHWLQSQYELPEKYFYDLIKGAESDLGSVRIADSEELRQYTYRVAGTVGLSMLHIFDVTGEQQRQLGKKMAHAFQLTNILRDISEDRERDRCYLPVSLLKRYNALEAWQNDEMTEGYRSALAELASEAEQSYNEAIKLLNSLSGRRRFTLALMNAAYSLYLARLYDVDFVASRANMRISKWTAPQLLWRGLRALLGSPQSCLYV